jgi:hydroxymethylpyrimidine pyrophosphatase-like HAD family hydrolase
MGNATEAVKAAAGDITLSNEESGVAAALRKYFPYA